VTDSPSLVRHAADNGACADVDKESTMNPTSQTENMTTCGGARPRHARPNSAPAYYLARPASFWITTTRYAGAPDVER
jgi:hypothetical protein